MRFGKKLERKKEKMKNIKDKDSEEYKKQASIVLKLSNQFSSKTKETEKSKEQVKNTIAVVRVGVQRNIDNLTQKVLETQNEKQNLEAEVKTLETEKIKYENTISQVGTDSRIPEDKKDVFVKNANKKIQELKEEISLKKSKILYISSELPEYINKIDEMKDNLKYLDYDEIEKYEVKEENKDEKDKKDKAEKKDGQQEENSSNDKPTQEEQSEASEVQKKNEEIRRQAEIIAEEKAARQRAEQEAIARKTKEEARRKETNEPYREGEELPEEQTEGLYEDGDEQEKEETNNQKSFIPIMYISEADNKIGYYSNEQGDSHNSTVKQALKEKKAKYNRLNIKEICKEIAGKRIASVLLYRKVNPRIIKALEDDPEMIHNYIKAIHNKEPLPFKLIHDVSGKSMIQRAMLKIYTVAEKASGARINTVDSNRGLGKGKESKQQIAQDEFSLEELLDNAQISEKQKTAIKDYAVMHGENEAKRAYDHTLADARQGLHIKKFKEASQNLPGKGENAGKTSKGKVTKESLDQKGLFSEQGDTTTKSKNADFVPKVGNGDGTLEKNARESAENKKEGLERVEGEIVYSGHQGPGIGE